MPFKKSHNTSRFFHGLNVMQRVIVAIILRETKTRFGKNKLGYLWAFIEPAIYVVLLLFIREKMHSSIPFGENIYLFILTGILIYRIFISISGRASNAISANQALLTYPVVKPIDTIIARVLLEALTMLVILAVFFLLLSVFYQDTVINYPVVFFKAVLAVVFLGSSVGVFNAVVTELFPAWDRIWSLLRLPLLFLSGIFYLPKMMPPLVQTILSWNPVLHCVEWLRSGSYLDYNPLLNENYVLWFSTISLAIGLLLERMQRIRLSRS